MTNTTVVQLNSNLYVVEEKDAVFYVDTENLEKMNKNLNFDSLTIDPLEPQCRNDKSNEIDKGAKYKVIIRNRYTGETLEVDTYDMVEALKIVCPAMSHAFKKMANAGKRGVKDYGKDCDEAINSIEQSKLLQKFRE